MVLSSAVFTSKGRAAPLFLESPQRAQRPTPSMIVRQMDFDVQDGFGEVSLLESQEKTQGPTPSMIVRQMDFDVQDGFGEVSPLILLPSSVLKR